MKKLLLFAVQLFLLTIHTAFSQSESPESKWALDKFQSYLNADQPDSIFNLFSPPTKTALPLDKTKVVLKFWKELLPHLKSILPKNPIVEIIEAFKKK